MCIHQVLMKRCIFWFLPLEMSDRQNKCTDVHVLLCVFAVKIYIYIYIYKITHTYARAYAVNTHSLSLSHLYARTHTYTLIDIGHTDSHRHIHQYMLILAIANNELTAHDIYHIAGLTMYTKKLSSLSRLCTTCIYCMLARQCKLLARNLLSVHSCFPDELWLFCNYERWRQRS